jgi:type I restriction enzyme, S subunit
MIVRTGWSLVPISTIAEVNPGPSRPLLDHEQVSFVPMASVRERGAGISSSTTKPTGEVRRKSYRYFEENDVIMAKITPCFENGKIAVARGLKSGRAFGSTEFHVLRPRSSAVDPTFLKYFLESPAFTALATRSMAGAVGQLRVPTRVLAQALIPLPPISEQRGVVAAIEEQLSRLESGQVSLETAAHRLDVIRGVIADRCGANSQQPPSGWRRITIGDIAGVRSGIQKQPKRRPISAAARPYLRVANVHRGRLALEDVQRMELFEGELNTYRLVSGDLLVVEGNGSSTEIGRAALWNDEILECVHQNHIIRVRPDSSAVEPGFLEIIWNAPATARRLAAMASSTSGLYVLNSAKVRSMTLAIPPTDKQRSMLAEVAEQRGYFSRLAIEVASARRKGQSLRRSILAAAFTGRLFSGAELGNAVAMNRSPTLSAAPQ